MMLLFLREKLPRESMLRDLADSVAHSVRDKGPTFVNLESYAQAIRTASTDGGWITARMVLPIETVIAELNDTLAQKGVSSQLTATSQSNRIRLAAALAIALDNTTYKLNDAQGSIFVSGDSATERSLRYRVQLDTGWSVASDLFLDVADTAAMNSNHSIVPELWTP